MQQGHRGGITLELRCHAPGQPMPRILVLDNNGRRGVFPDEVGDPQAGEGDVKGTQDRFNPAAFRPPADGTFGNSGRAPFRQPGYHKWDMTLSKNFYLFGETRMQFRADFINVFNQVNWNADPLSNGLDNTCTNAVDLTHVREHGGSDLRPRPPGAGGARDSARHQALLVDTGPRGRSSRRRVAAPAFLVAATGACTAAAIARPARSRYTE